VIDDGSADPRLAAALQSYDGSARARAETLAALAGARVFVAITATSTAQHVEAGTGLPAESSAEMALVSVVASDGERAIPAFADTAALKRWRLDVRPVPVDASYLARAALDDGAAAVLIDPAGAAVVVRRSDLTSLAAGYVPVAGSPLAARRTTTVLAPPAAAPDAELVRALAAALAPERPRAARLLDGPGGPVLGIAPRRPLDPASLAALAQRVMTRLGGALPAQGLDVTLVPPTGPGHPVIRRRRLPAWW
jgi:hypothetical protein